MDLFEIGTHDTVSPTISFDDTNQTVVFKPKCDTKLSVYVGPPGITFTLAGPDGKFFLSLNRDLSVVYDWSDIKWAVTNPEGSPTYEMVKVIHNPSRQAQGNRIAVRPGSFPLRIDGKTVSWNRQMPKSAQMYLPFTVLSPSSTSIRDLYERPEETYETPSSDDVYSMSSQLGVQSDHGTQPSDPEEIATGTQEFETETPVTPPATSGSPKTPSTVQRPRNEVGSTPLLEDNLVSQSSCGKPKSKQTQKPEASMSKISKKAVPTQKAASQPGTVPRARSSSSSRPGSRSSSNSSLSKRLTKTEDRTKKGSKVLSQEIDKNKKGIRSQFAEVKVAARHLNFQGQQPEKDKKKKNKIPLLTPIYYA